MALSYLTSLLLDPVPAHHCALGKGTSVSEALDREFPSTGVWSISQSFILQGIIPRDKRKTEVWYGMGGQQEQDPHHAASLSFPSYPRTWYSPFLSKQRTRSTSSILTKSTNWRRFTSRQIKRTQEETTRTPSHRQVSHWLKTKYDPKENRQVIQFLQPICCSQSPPMKIFQKCAFLSLQWLVQSPKQVQELLH